MGERDRSTKAKLKAKEPPLEELFWRSVQIPPTVWRDNLPSSVENFEVRARPRLRDLQKEMTRELIKKSARTVFETGEYDSISVDDIAQSAGVSRATVYSHFGAKYDILVELVRDDLQIHLALIKDLTALPSVDEPSIRSWLERVVNVSRETGCFVNRHVVIFRSYPEKFSLILDHREQVLALLGKTFRGFDLSLGGPAMEEKRRAQCYLMLFLLEQATISYATPDSLHTGKAALDILAGVLSTFLQSGEIHSVL